jgi:integrase
MSRIKSKKYTGVFLNRLNNKDTSYSIMYKDLSGKSIRFTLGKKSEGITEVYAYNKRSEFINKVRLGEDPQAHKKKQNILTLDDVAKQHYEYKALHNRNNQHSYRAYELHISPLLGKIPLTAISRKDVEKLQYMMMKKTFKGRLYSKKSINKILGELSVIFSYAIERDLIESSPTRKVKALKSDNARERYLNVDEIKQLLDTIRDESRLYIFVLFALTTGARSGAIHKLRKKDIDLKNKIANIKDEKSDTTYKVFLENDELVELLRGVLFELRSDDVIMHHLFNNKQSQNKALSELRPIFETLFNSQLDTHDYKHRVVVHTLRHTFASNLAINGVPLYTIQKLMNHKDISMTMRYAKLSSETGRDAVKGLYDIQG